MKLKVTKCPACGASVEISDNTREIRCQYCNSPIIIEEKAEELLKLNKCLKLGERYYKDKEYTEAYTIYKKAVEIEPDNYIAVLRKGLCRSLCSTYKNFQVKYSTNSIKNCYDILKKENKGSIEINKCILECNNVILELKVLATEYYSKNKSDMNSEEITEYVTRLQLCLAAFEYLYLLIEKDKKVENIIIDAIIETIDNILEKKKYEINKFTETGELYKYNKKYKLDKELKEECLQKKEKYINRQIEINPESIKVKEKELRNNKIYRVVSNIKEDSSYIMVFFSIFMVLGSLTYPLIYTTLVWGITAIIYLPKVKKAILSKSNNSIKLIRFLRIALPLIGCITLANEMPTI